MDGEKRERLRSELGLERPQWETAIRLGYFYSKFSQLSRLDREPFEKTLVAIARELYGMIFRPLGFELLDKERRCLWFWDRYVSLLKSIWSDTLVAATNNRAASNAEMEASSKV